VTSCQALLPPLSCKLQVSHRCQTAFIYFTHRPNLLWNILTFYTHPLPYIINWKPYKNLNIIRMYSIYVYVYICLCIYVYISSAQFWMAFYMFLTQ
jgi:hypothetical protein